MRVPFLVVGVAVGAFGAGFLVRDLLEDSTTVVTPDVASVAPPPDHRPAPPNSDPRPATTVPFRPDVEKNEEPAGKDGRTELPASFGSLITGRVLDDGGRPLFRAPVMCGPPPSELDAKRLQSQIQKEWRRASTDREGRFQFLMRGRPCCLCVAVPGFVVKDVGPFVPRAGHHELPDIQLDKGVTISGRVLDGQGKPMVWKTVVASVHGRPPTLAQAMRRGASPSVWGPLVRSYLPHRPRPLRALSDKDGRYTLQGLEAREYWLSMHCGDWLPVPAGQFVNAPATGVDFTLAKGGIIRGRVINPDPTQAAFEYGVVFRGADGDEIKWATTERDGSFELAGFDEQTGSLEAAIGGEEFQTMIQSGVRPPGPGVVRGVSIGPGRCLEDVRIVLDRTVPTVGRVVDEEGNALAGCRVVVEGGGLHDIEVETDAEGRFRFAGLPRRPLTLKAHAEDRVTLPVEMAPDGAAHEIVARRPGEIVLDATLGGTRSSPLGIYLTRADGDEVGCGPLRQGKNPVRDLYPGTYRIVIKDPETERELRKLGPVEVRGGGPVHLTVVIR